jgi:hypothetical protein
MFLDSSPATARRSPETRRRRGACIKPTRQSAVSGEQSRPVSAPARPSRLDDAIVAQWLLDQVPSAHRHAVGR